MPSKMLPIDVANLRVLVADDNPGDMLILQTMLRHLGFCKIDEAIDGSIAFKKLCNAPYDLIITDWQMPLLDGVTLIKNIRSDKRLRDIPTILLTGNSAQDQVVQAISAGVSGYIVKPIDKEILLMKLQTILPNVSFES